MKHKPNKVTNIKEPYNINNLNNLFTCLIGSEKANNKVNMIIDRYKANTNKQTNDKKGNSYHLDNYYNHAKHLQ